MRLYIKVTDDVGTPIPRSEWRTRVEVTLNAPALDAVLDVRTVGDLHRAKLRKLGGSYLRLARPVEDPPRRFGSARSHASFRKSMLALLKKKAVRDVVEALRQGNATQHETGMVTYKTVPQLTTPIKTALDNYTRGVARLVAKAS
jgi:hypothetical protein